MQQDEKQNTGAGNSGDNYFGDGWCGWSGRCSFKNPHPIPPRKGEGGLVARHQSQLLDGAGGSIVSLPLAGRDGAKRQGWGFLSISSACRPRYSAAATHALPASPDVLGRQGDTGALHTEPARKRRFPLSLE